jgi:hypothetical protein
MFGQSNGSSDLKKRPGIQLFLTIAGGIGIIAIFLPFTLNTSPWVAALESFNGEFLMNKIWRIALPAFFPVLITMALLRWHIQGTLSRPECFIAYLVSAASVMITLSVCFENGWPKELKERLIIVIPILALALGIFALFRNRQNMPLNPFRAIAAMQIAYMVNCLLCLTGFFGGWQIGAYCCLAAVVVYLIQMILVFRKDISLIEAIRI